MCGPDWTVRPHRYTPTLPGVRGMKSRTKRVAVSYRRSVTLQGYPAGIAHNERVAGETAQTLDRGLRLLHLVADAPGGLTMSEAAARRGGVAGAAPAGRTGRCHGAPDGRRRWRGGRAGRRRADLDAVSCRVPDGLAASAGPRRGRTGNPRRSGRR